MACIPSKNTRPELLLAKLLRKNKIRFRRHYKITGSPDFVLLSKKVAIFVDGDFWHGNNWKLRGLKSLKEELASYKKFWSNKIKNNFKRDIRVTYDLQKRKWKVLRFWESDLKKGPEKISRTILKTLQTRRPSI